MDTENYPTWGSHTEVAAEPISELEVHELAEGWFRALEAHAPLHELEPFFAPGVRIQAPDGTAHDLEGYLRLHDRWRDESHRIVSLGLEAQLGPIARAVARVEIEWEATLNREGTPERIRAVLGEEWTIERGPGARPRFARYTSAEVRPLPGSAPLETH